MSDKIREFKQLHTSLPNLHVTIHKGAIVKVANSPVNTSREQALAWIILRLNAQSQIYQQENITLKEELKKTKEMLDKTNKTIDEIKEVLKV
jgi:uncharacterized protein YpuA (DUF1002 family)